MPPAFVELIADSLSGLSSCVRTAYGISEPFEVQRSLRQGDPLAPLLFVVLMDGLHDGLECNPFTGQVTVCACTGATVPPPPSRPLGTRTTPLSWPIRFPICACRTTGCITL